MNDMHQKFYFSYVTSLKKAGENYCLYFDSQIYMQSSTKNECNSQTKVLKKDAIFTNCY